jgi:hypothetical protein
MADAKTPMQRQREERRALGWRDVNWIRPGTYTLEAICIDDEWYEVLVDTSLGFTRATWRDLHASGGVSLDRNWGRESDARPYRTSSRILGGWS